MAVSSVKYADLVAADASRGRNLHDVIAEGFGRGADCLGIILVTDLPDSFIIKRERLLRLSAMFAEQSDEIKNSCVHVESSYSFGWSHGKEMMEGSPDVAKGSYYNNPTVDVPAAAEGSNAYAFRNVWPTHMPEFRESYMDVGGFIVDVGIMLARHCDLYLADEGIDIKLNIGDAVRDSQTHKARLLHYFAMRDVDVESAREGGKEGDWCGLHVDHSLLTGLTSALYTDANGKIHAAPESSGLFIKTRGDRLTRISIPVNALAFQVGEAAQVASGGRLVATPHLVRSGDDGGRGLVRDTFAVFLQPPADAVLAENVTFDSFTKEVMKRHY